MSDTEGKGEDQSPVKRKAKRPKPQSLEEWAQQAWDPREYAELPEMVAYSQTAPWVVAHLGAWPVPFRGAPSRQAIARLRQLTLHPVAAARYVERWEERKAKLEESQQAKRADDGRDLADTLRRLARLRAQAEAEARHTRQVALAEAAAKATAGTAF